MLRSVPYKSFGFWDISPIFSVLAVIQKVKIMLFFFFSKIIV